MGETEDGRIFKSSLTINFNDKSFHSSIEWSGLHFQGNIPPWWGKVFRFTKFRLLENALVKHRHLPWHDLIISPPYRPTQNKFAKKGFSPHEKVFLEKIPPY